MKANYLLISAVIISIGTTLPRFAAGIPMGIDTTSHLYRILFLQQWLKQGILPFWSSDWYAGSPAILLYPPLGYYLAVGLSMLGVDPVLSYKLVDSGFYWLTPIMLYFLGKELGFSRGESALGAILYSVIPEVIENYLFFDRFPTVISIPIFCAFIMMFHRALTNKSWALSTLGSILTMSALLLTHHLSALIAGIVAVLMLMLAVGEQRFTKPVLTTLAVAAGTLGLTAFWLVPFLRSIGLFSGNGFYNRNVLFPFLRFTYFGFDVTSYLLGIAQFVFGSIAVLLIVGKVFEKARVNAMAFLAFLFTGMAVFQAGELADQQFLRIAGQVVVVGSFLVFLGQFIISPDARSVFKKQNGALLTFVWFIAFLWMGLGYYALPILQFPYINDVWIRTMDVYRIWLYFALPLSVLAAFGFLRAMMRIVNKRQLLALALVILTATPIVLGVGLTANFSLNHTVNAVLPYTAANADIPSELIHYFRSDSSPGRILGINVPFWVYLLPNYVDKPILDGWYPQSKLVTTLVEINDYRLDDLETTNNTGRIATWKLLISDSQQLEITWVIVGERALADNLTSALKDAGFNEQVVVSYHSIELVIFKVEKVSSYVIAPGNFVNSISRPNPDVISLSVRPLPQTTTIIVKEAYFPTWAARADGSPITVQREANNSFIQLNIPSGTHEVTLYQTPQPNTWNLISTGTLVFCLALTGIIGFRNKTGIGRVH